jgi:hypothetical protein
MARKSRKSQLFLAVAALVGMNAAVIGENVGTADAMLATMDIGKLGNASFTGTEVYTVTQTASADIGDNVGTAAAPATMDIGKLGNVSLIGTEVYTITKTAGDVDLDDVYWQQLAGLDLDEDALPNSTKPIHNVASKVLFTSGNCQVLSISETYIPGGSWSIEQRGGTALARGD